MSEPGLFPAHPRYRLLFAASVLIALLLAWAFGRGLLATIESSASFGSATALDQADWFTLLFLLIMLAATAWFARVMSSSVELTPDGVTLRSRFGRLGGTRHVAFRQITGVDESGRLGTSLTLLYHPLHSDGLVDTETIRALALPGVVDQETLLEAILQRAKL